MASNANIANDTGQGSEDTGSAAWFERNASPAQVKTIYGFKTDKVNVYDEYDVAGEW